MKILEQAGVYTGIQEEGRKKTAQGLSKVLADTYMLYLKTQNFHWNVTGAQFVGLHAFFEEQYKELADAVDLIAERIRALGFVTPATYMEFSELTSIQEVRGDISAEQMILSLKEGNEAVGRTLHQVFKDADAADDQATVDLLSGRMEKHEKAAWMLRSML